ncbi:MAG: hypothetical protein FJ098_07635, partial [Deltaproteobacteria bacterium]|nr:hypothetical protein [Deltaproteobacteria bacterium]
MKRILDFLFLFLVATAVGACGEGPDEEGEKPESNGKDPALAADQWNATNNPTQFHVDFIYKYTELKQYTQGRAEQIPWPSDYRSYYQDSVNVRYKGLSTTDWSKLSPAEKYDLAFNNWQPPTNFL